MSLVDNRKAGFNYELLDRYEAGLELFGHEVKSLRAGRGSLDAAYVAIRGSEAFVLGMQIPPYQAANTPAEYDAHRARRLLLTRQEILVLSGVETKKGFTLVPLSVFAKGRVIKLAFAVARGKKKYDKRETIKRRETDREMRRTLKGSH